MQSQRASESSPSPTDPAVEFVLRLGRALHDQGAPAHRLEDAISAVAARLGLSGQIFSTPTILMASFREGGAVRTFLERVDVGGVDLGRLAELDAIASKVERGELTPERGVAAIDAVLGQPARYGPLLTLLCYGLNSAAATRFFGGGMGEALAALAVGLLIGGLALAPRFQAFEPVAAFAGSALAIVLSWFFQVSAPITTVSGLIVLLPGFSLTVAMTELSTRHLASGSARLVGAIMTFLTIAFGVALASKIGSLLHGDSPVFVPGSVPHWTQLPALVVAGLTFGIIFRAAPRDLVFILLATCAGFGGARAGATWLGPELGAFAGALVVALASNAYSRILRRPALVPLVPGILLLVPGSLGFRGLNSMMSNEVLPGLQVAFTAIVVAVAIVGGLLLANEVVSPRGAL